MINHLILEYLNRLCHLVLFIPKNSFLSTVTACGGDYRIWGEYWKPFLLYYFIQLKLYSACLCFCLTKCCRMAFCKSRLIHIWYYFYIIFQLQYTWPGTSDQHLSRGVHIFNCISHIWPHSLCSINRQHAGESIFYELSRS